MKGENNYLVSAVKIRQGRGSAHAGTNRERRSKPQSDFQHNQFTIIGNKTAELHYTHYEPGFSQQSERKLSSHRFRGRRNAKFPTALFRTGGDTGRPERETTSNSRILRYNALPFLNRMAASQSLELTYSLSAFWKWLGNYG